MSGAVDAGQAAAPLWMSGGTGLVGRRLRRALARAGRSLRIVSRRPELLPKEAGTELFPWDGLHPPQASLALFLLLVGSVACSASRAGRRLGLDPLLDEQLPSWLTWTHRHTTFLS